MQVLTRTSRPSLSAECRRRSIEASSAARLPSFAGGVLRQHSGQCIGMVLTGTSCRENQGSRCEECRNTIVWQPFLVLDLPIDQCQQHLEMRQVLAAMLRG